MNDDQRPIEEADTYIYIRCPVQKLFSEIDQNPTEDENKSSITGPTPFYEDMR